jgi:hypothetical protein
MRGVERITNLAVTGAGRETTVMSRTVRNREPPGMDLRRSEARLQSPALTP